MTSNPLNLPLSANHSFFIQFYIKSFKYLSSFFSFSSSIHLFFCFFFMNTACTLHKNYYILPITWIFVSIANIRALWTFSISYIHLFNPILQLYMYISLPAPASSCSSYRNSNMAFIVCWHVIWDNLLLLSFVEDGYWNMIFFSFYLVNISVCAQ